MEGERLRLNMREVRSGSMSFMRNSSRTLLVSSAKERDDGQKGSWFRLCNWRWRRALFSRLMYQMARKRNAAKVMTPMTVAAAMEILPLLHLVPGVRAVTGGVADGIVAIVKLLSSSRSCCA